MNISELSRFIINSSPLQFARFLQFFSIIFIIFNKWKINKNYCDFFSPQYSSSSHISCQLISTSLEYYIEKWKLKNKISHFTMLIMICTTIITFNSLFLVSKLKFSHSTYFLPPNNITYTQVSRWSYKSFFFHLYKIFSIVLIQI